MQLVWLSSRFGTWDLRNVNKPDLLSQRPKSWPGIDLIWWQYRRSHGTRKMLKEQKRILLPMEKSGKIVN